MSRFGPSIFEKSRGKWRGVLVTLGVEGKLLSGKNCPCPQCGGTDRFRWLDTGGDGTNICNSCGAMSGFQLAQAVTGISDFAEMAKRIEEIIGDVSQDPSRPGISEDDRRQMLRDLWSSGRAIAKGDPVDVYLSARGLDEAVYPRSLRIVPSLAYTSQLAFPAMIARVEDRDGQPLTIHRTWVQDGEKAPVDTPRKIMPGRMGAHGAVRLAPAGETLGVAEGIETAMHAGDRFNVPTWAALNAGSLAAFDWPEGVKELVIFGDHDASFTGQAAAYTLAKRAVAKGLSVSVLIPGIQADTTKINTDWADVAHDRRNPS